MDGISFSIQEGETLGLVGEPGCGKSTAGNCILRLLQPNGGSIDLNAVNIHNFGSKDMKAARLRKQDSFQDRYSYLNPCKPIRDSILAGLKIH